VQSSRRKCLAIHRAAFPDTTKEDILEYLSENRVEGRIHCNMVSEKINSKAFKIGIPMHELERVHNSSWPSDIYCRPFQQPWKFRGARTHH
jgi:hypothetical protein